MTVSDASAARYASDHILAMYLHAEWGDLLTRDVRHFPGADTCLPELTSPGFFYRTVAELVHGWVERQPRKPLTVCDVGAGTGRNVFELAGRLTSVAEFTVVEPSRVFCEWTSRLLVEAPRELRVPTPGRAGAPDWLRVAAQALPRFPVPLRVLNLDAETFAGDSETFDLVTSFNVLDRVPDPAAFTSTVCSLVSPGGLLVMACPFDFEDQYTPRDRWVSDLRDVVPAGSFELLDVADVPYSFKQFGRRFNWYLSQVVVARRR